jgi:hypothetical protein
MPTLHVVVSKDLKRWLEKRAKQEEIHGSLSRYCAQVLTAHRATIGRNETAPESPTVVPQERIS